MFGYRQRVPSMATANELDAPGVAGALVSFRRRVVTFAVFASVGLGFGLSDSHSWLHGWDGRSPWLRLADLAFGVGAYVGLWWRREHPVGFAVYAVLVGSFSTLSSALTLVAAFNIAAQRDWRIAAPLSVLLAAAAWPYLLLYEGNTADSHTLFLIIIVATSALTTAGMYTRARRALTEQLHDRARQAEASREQYALLARVAERQRIAREMHDVLAHRLSLLAVQAGAMEATAGLTAAESAQVAGAIRSTAHLALTELRSVINVLREEATTGSAAPQPTASNLPALVHDARAAANVHADLTGLDLEAVPPITGRTLYRIVQEGLTNARKHAPDSSVSMTLTGAPKDGIDIALSSWLPVDRPSSEPMPGAGVGLLGLRERATLAGGHLHAGRTADDRFELTAWLPWEAV